MAEEKKLAHRGASIYTIETFLDKKPIKSVYKVTPTPKKPIYRSTTSPKAGIHLAQPITGADKTIITTEFKGKRPEAPPAQKSPARLEFKKGADLAVAWGLSTNRPKLPAARMTTYASRARLATLDAKP